MTATPDPTTTTTPRRRGRPRKAEPAAAHVGAAGIGHNGGPPLADSLSMTIKEACRTTGISKDGMYDLIRPGPHGEPPEVRSFMMLTRRYIESASLRAYIERRAGEPVSVRRGPNTREPGHPAAPAPRAKPGLSDPRRRDRGVDCADRNDVGTRYSAGSWR